MGIHSDSPSLSMNDAYLHGFIQLLPVRGVNPVKDGQVKAGRNNLAPKIPQVPGSGSSGEAYNPNQFPVGGVDLYFTLVVGGYSSKRSGEVDRAALVDDVGISHQRHLLSVERGNEGIPFQLDGIPVGRVLCHDEVVKAVGHPSSVIRGCVPLDHCLAVQIDRNRPTRAAGIRGKA